MKFIAYPLLFLANAIAWTWAIQSHTDPAGAFFLTFLGTLIALILLERLIPFEQAWQPNRREWLRDALYFGMNGGLDALGKALVGVSAVYLASPRNGLPLWADILLALLVVDGVGYWLHRLGHRGWLWRVHGVHHTPTRVNTANNNTAHFLNILYGATLPAMTLLLCGVSPEAALIALGASSLQSFAMHANVDVHLPGLDRVLMTPTHHRLHHSTRLEEAGNFATIFTCWDRVFGTYVYAAGRRPEAVGVVHPEHFPAPNDVLGNALHPFVPTHRPTHVKPTRTPSAG